MSILDPLILDYEHASVLRAAAGVRPPLAANEQPPSRVVRFAPSLPTYRVTDDGGGTVITLHGTTETNHSCAAIITGYYPSLFVELPPDIVPQRLIVELQTTLGALIALDKRRQWAPERLAMRAGAAGRMQFVGGRNRGGRSDTAESWQIVPPTFDKAVRARPIVGWEIVHATVACGMGPRRGYSGLEPSRMLQIYFYCPQHLVLARTLLHGIGAELGFERQMRYLLEGGDRNKKNRFGTRESATSTTATVAAAATNGATNAMGVRRMFMSKPVDTDETHEEASASGGASILDDPVDDPIETALLHEMNTQVDMDEDSDGDGGGGGGGGNGSDDDGGDYGDPAVGGGGEHAGGGGGENPKKSKFNPNVLLEKHYVGAMTRAWLDTRCAADYLSTRVPFTVARADLDFVLAFAVDAEFVYEGWVSIDIDAPPLTVAGSFDGVSDLRATELHSNAGDDRFSAWQLSRTPPGIEPRIYDVECRVYGESKETTAQIELHCDWHHLRPLPPTASAEGAALAQRIPHKVQLMFDCEMRTAPDGSFPRPEQEDVLTIGCAVTLPPSSVPGAPTLRYVAFTLDQTEAVPPVRPSDGAEERTLCFASELTMLRAFCVFIKALSPDDVVSFNGDTFDLPYLDAVATRLKMQDEFRAVWSKSTRVSKGKVARHSGALRLVPGKFESKIHGTHLFTDAASEGTFFIDAYQYFKRGIERFEGYSLQALSQAILKDKKADVGYAEINELQQSATGRRRLTSYCLKDAWLAWQLLCKREVFLQLVQRARVTGATKHQLLKRGMQIQCKVLMARAGRRGMLVPAEAAEAGIVDAGRTRMVVAYTRTDAERRAESSLGAYEGATVLDPKRRFETAPVGTLDFNSLYPSIMASMGMCWLTLVRPGFDWRRDAWLSYCVRSGRCTEAELFHVIGTPPPVGSVTTSVDGGEFVEHCDEKSVRFLQQHVLMGMLPTVQVALIVERKAVRRALKPIEKELDELKALKQATDEQRARRLDLERSRAAQDALQLTLKLVGNSTYGYTGAHTSGQFCREIADSVTRVGRSCIMYAKHITERLAFNLPPALVATIEAFPALKSPVISLPAGVDVLRALKVQLELARTECALLPPVERRTRADRANASLRAMFAQTTKNGKSSTISNANVSPEAIDLVAMVIYGDTDSIFPRFWAGCSLERAARICIVLADLVSILMHVRYGTRLRECCIFRIEFEKIFERIVIFRKKRYAGRRFVLDGERDVLVDKGIWASGLESNRRDSTLVVAEGVRQVLRILLLDDGKQKRTAAEIIARARAYVYKAMVEPLLNGTMSRRRIGLSKQFRKPVEQYGDAAASAPHVQVAIKQALRTGGLSAPRPGDRVAYVICVGSAHASAASRAEDPQYSLEHGVAIDGAYYLEKHVEPAMIRLFEPLVLGDHTDVGVCATSKADGERRRHAMVREYLFRSLFCYEPPEDLDAYANDLGEFLLDRAEFANSNARGQRRVRYPPRRAPSSAMGVVLEAGARCARCAKHEPGRYAGFVCDECVQEATAAAIGDSDDETRALAHRTAGRLLIDMEDLIGERSRIYWTCQRCLGREKRPAPIQCPNSKCPTYWERMENEHALSECRTRQHDAARSADAVAMAIDDDDACDDE